MNTPIIDEIEAEKQPVSVVYEKARELENCLHLMASELRAKRVSGWFQPNSPALETYESIIH